MFLSSLCVHARRWPTATAHAHRCDAFITEAHLSKRRQERLGTKSSLAVSLLGCVNELLIGRCHLCHPIRYLLSVAHFACSGTHTYQLLVCLNSSHLHHGGPSFKRFVTVEALAFTALTVSSCRVLFTLVAFSVCFAFNLTRLQCSSCEVSVTQ